MYNECFIRCLLKWAAYLNRNKKKVAVLMYRKFLKVEVGVFNVNDLINTRNSFSTPVPVEGIKKWSSLVQNRTSVLP
jgi:hypothetical protein